MSRLTIVFSILLEATIFLFSQVYSQTNLKGVCKNITATTYFPIITVSSTASPTTIITTITTPSNSTASNNPSNTTLTTIPTFQPSIPTNSTTTTPTPNNCPAVPSLCLPGGISPNPPCPCIDPRTQRLPLRVARLPKKNKNFKSNDCLTLAKRNGKCVQVDSCPNLIEEYFYKLQATPVTFESFLKSITCEVNTDSIKICCPSRVIPKPISPLQILGSPGSPSLAPSQPKANNNSVISIFSFSALNYNPPETNDDAIFVPLSIIGNIPSTMTTTVKPPPPPLTTAASNKLVSGAIPQNKLNQCGMHFSIATRIVGGTEARRGAYPWMTALGYITKTETEFLCGGSLITTKHVITAAHCINNDLSFARLGAYNLAQKETTTSDIKIAKKIPHEAYNSNTNANDIGLLKLEKDAVISDQIVPICLPYELNKDLTGMNPFVAGWGAQKFKQPTSSILRESQVQVVGINECKKNYSTKFTTITIDDKFICAGGGVIDSCQGDSGGPLMLPQVDTTNQITYYYLIGIVSFGFECAVPGFPGVYTKVNSYIKWIENSIKL